LGINHLKKLKTIKIVFYQFFQFFPVYNPMPGSWFIAAYLEPMDEPLGFLQNKCRYSLGSIALWTNADNVDLIQVCFK
jgi:hypothetical protein